jgi:hypothetical protein
MAFLVHVPEEQSLAFSLKVSFGVMYSVSTRDSAPVSKSASAHDADQEFQIMDTTTVRIEFF